MSVAELDRRLKQAVENVSVDVWVHAEISGLRIAASGHAYFSLKDSEQDALIDAVAYRAVVVRLRSVLSEGAKVLVRGKATVWAPKGKLQFVVETARPAGRGALLEALEALKRKLHQEGLFDTHRKQRVPPDARSIGVVTSSTGAVIHDIVRVAFRRGPVSILLSPAVVQGEQAANSIIEALDRIERVASIDVIIVGRGGGSLEDLMAFNDERVVRRIAACRVPVVSAVGHEVDVTLTDLVADARASTPSQAAEMVVADQQVYARALLQLRVRLARAMTGQLKDERNLLAEYRRRITKPVDMIAQHEQRIDDFLVRAQQAIKRRLERAQGELVQHHRRLLARHPQAVVIAARNRVTGLHFRLDACMRSLLQQRHARLDQYQTRLAMLSPRSVLARGYAIALNQHGKAILDAAQVDPGHTIHVILSAGEFDATVTRRSLSKV